MAWRDEQGNPAGGVALEFDMAALRARLGAIITDSDLVILDVMLPGLDGFEVCHRLRSDPQTSNLPVIMYSGKVREIDKLTGEKVGANEYLNKPINLAELLAKTESLIQSQTVA